MIKTCSFCDRPFRPPPNGKFCSKRCATAYRAYYERADRRLRDAIAKDARDCRSKHL